MSDKDRIGCIPSFLRLALYLGCAYAVAHLSLVAMDELIQRGDAWAQQRAMRDCMPIRNDVNTVVGSSCDHYHE